MQTRYSVTTETRVVYDNTLFRLVRDGEEIDAWISDVDIIKTDNVYINAGVFWGGVFHGGEFHGGVFHGGVFHGGEFHGGVFWGGEFHGGEFHGGVFHGGVFRGGVFRGGVFHGGVFHGGVFWGGEFHGGVFHGGEFHGGVFWGGVSRGGVFHGGVFHGGVFRGGELIIQGSRHVVILVEDHIWVGCEDHSIRNWIDNGREIGEKNGYSDSEIEEYKLYIDLAIRIYELRRVGSV